MNVSLSNGWGIVRTIADLALKQPEGKYVLVKDPNNVRRLERLFCIWSEWMG
jgi:translation initiation factor 3 subunit D